MHVHVIHLQINSYISYNSKPANILPHKNNTIVVGRASVKSVIHTEKCIKYLFLINHSTFSVTYLLNIDIEDVACVYCIASEVIKASNKREERRMTVRYFRTVPTLIPYLLCLYYVQHLHITIRLPIHDYCTLIENHKVTERRFLLLFFTVEFAGLMQRGLQLYRF